MGYCRARRRNCHAAHLGTARLLLQLIAARLPYGCGFALLARRRRFDDLDEQWLRSRPGVKWAAADDGVLPSWVADMDFPAPGPVVEALVRLAEGGDLGYPAGSEVALLEEKWAARMATRYRWNPLPGSYGSCRTRSRRFRVLIELASSPGDGVLLLTPSYPSFVRDAGRNGPPPRPRASRARRGQFGLRLGRCCRRGPRGEGPPAREPPQPDGADAGPGRAVSARRTGRAQRPARYLRRDTRRPCAVRARPHPVRFAVGGPRSSRTVTRVLGQQGLQPRRHVLCGSPRRRSRNGAPAHDVQHTMGRVSIAAVATTLAAWSPEGDAWLERCRSPAPGEPGAARAMARRHRRGRRCRGAGQSPRGHLPVLAGLPRRRARRRPG